MQLSRFTRRILTYALLGLTAAACAPAAASPHPTPTPMAVASPTEAGELVTKADQITGVWQIYYPHCQIGYLLVRPDGTFTIACQPDGSNGNSGKYTLEDGRFMPNSVFCEGGSFEARLMGGQGESKTLVFSVVKDDCPGEVEIFTKQPLTYVSPLP